MEILTDIGLTKTESAVYERLLRLGEVSVSALQKSLKLHPQIIYRTVEGLGAKGLVAVYSKKNKKYVSPEHPKKLEELEKARLARLKDAMPELMQMMQPHKQDALVKTSVGIDAIRAFRRLAIDTLKHDDSLLIIGASPDRFYTAMGDEFGEIETKRIKKKIWRKIIASPAGREQFEKDPYREHTLFRYFSASQPATSTITIFANHVGITIWATDPILLHIRNEDVAASYRHYFDELWKASSA
ncbi:hypothetical protein HZC00_05110 [Candidatus Kaiserbacteria bacterium]|nr:hypothetical protein [Candidatus Kaiserbacteria bacterium]